MKKSCYVCVHVIQVLPACCVNRDDTGTPKSMFYGGSRRARVSSQCWKRAMRLYMAEKYGDAGVRVKNVDAVIAARLAAEKEIKVEDVASSVKAVLKKSGVSENTSAFFSQAQIDAIYAIFLDAYENGKINGITKKAICKALMEAPSESQLLFGRMFANDQSLNYDAASQVAHAFSVNATADETDYFTAVGDIHMNESSAGSDHIDSKLFNSSVLYRFADVNVSEGSELTDPANNVDAAKAVAHFIESFVRSMPSGSINSYGNATQPEVVVVEMRDDCPVSFAPAFLKAIDGEDIVEDAVKKLYAYEEKVSRNYGAPVRRWVLNNEEGNLMEICSQVSEEISRRL